ncbi:hypothetical protein ACSQ67_008337 [Phaseolus vulgaris]
MFKPQTNYESSLRERCADFPASRYRPTSRLYYPLTQVTEELPPLALMSEYFSVRPYPCNPSNLPKYSPSKEMDVKVQEDSSRKKIEGKMREVATSRRQQRRVSRLMQDQNNLGKSSSKENMQNISQNGHRDDGKTHLTRGKGGGMYKEHTKSALDTMSETSQMMNVVNGNGYSVPLQVPRVEGNLMHNVQFVNQGLEELLVGCVSRQGLLKVPRVWAGAASQSAVMRNRDPICHLTELAPTGRVRCGWTKRDCRRGHRHWLGSTSISMRRQSILPPHQIIKMDRSTGRSGGGSVDMFLPNYKLGKTLGIGSFGKVKIAEHVLTGHKVAIKILNRHKIRSMEMEEKVRREIKILRLFMHHHIIRLYEVIETSTDIYVVMEYVKSGELFDYIVEKGRLQEDEARHFFQQIISGVEYCHRNMVVHRDLKPENLLLDSKFNIKIADFGLSNIMRDGHFLKTSCGSPNYAAPEVISGKLYAGPEVDVWSCGVILYALLCGTLPFDDENIPNLFKKIKGGIYTLPSHLSPGARELIPRMLVVDPMKRMTIPEIRQHPWFQVRLPRYLAVPPPDTLQQAKKIDEEVIQEVVNMGFDRNQLVESLANRIQNKGTVTYYLLFDNRFRVFSGYLGAEFQETMDSGFNRVHSSEVAPPVVGHHSTGYMDYQGVGLRQQFPAERKWALGLQSRAQPREIMTEVLKALQELNVCWKKIGHYNMKCRWVASIPGNHEGMINNSVHSNHYFGNDSNIIEDEAVSKSNVVKFEVQLYKAREEKYLLDLQRVQGPQFLFLDLCAAFLSQLRVL